MIVLKAMVAGDKRSLSVSLLGDNLAEVPMWISGNSLPVGQWSLDLELADGSTDTATNLQYPVEYHKDYGTETRIDKIKLYRTIGSNELYFELGLGSNSCQEFDFFFVFEEVADESQS